jgi:hypothetical protein
MVTSIKSMQIRSVYQDELSKQLPTHGATGLEMKKSAIVMTHNCHLLRLKRKGKEIRKAFVDAIPGMSESTSIAINVAAKRGYIKSIDGRSDSLLIVHISRSTICLQSGAGVSQQSRWLIIYQNDTLTTTSCVHLSLHLYMTNCNLNPLQNIQKIYQASWYLVLQKLENTTNP